MSTAASVRIDRSGDALRIADRVTGQMYALGVPTSASSTDPVERTDEFPAPVDRTVTLSTDRIDLPEPMFCWLHDADGELIHAIEEDPFRGDLSGPAGGFLELSTLVKTYLRFEEPFAVRGGADGFHVDLGGRAQVTVGARAWHCYPEATIRIDERPRDLMAAVSRFGSSLRTTSPERAYPTLRGHPPAVRVGEETAFPDGVTEPDTDVELVVPPDPASICAVAPLAYYLPATLTPGDRFAVRCGDEEFVPPGADVASAAAAVLRHCFTLDCFVRSAGIYPTEVVQRRRFEETAAVDLDYAALYEASPAERTARYLRVPFEAVAPHVPPWPTTVVVPPTVRSVEALPGFVVQLATVRAADPPRHTGAAARTRVARAFAGDGTPTRATGVGRDLAAPVVEVPASDSRRTVWAGDGIPLNAVAFRLAGRRHRYDRATAPRTETTGTSVAVVCNDASMAGESEGVPEPLESRPDLEADYSLHRRTTTAQLRRIIERETDYLHFIGHATAEGLECVDGRLDVADVDHSGVRLFCLNACRSFRQGELLVEQGSVGGIVTVADVASRLAGEIGPDVVTLLDGGMPICGVTDFVRAYTDAGRQYLTLGDPYASLFESSPKAPALVHLDSTDEGVEAAVEPVSCAGANPVQLGAYLGDTTGLVDEHYLVPARMGPVVIDEADLPAYLADLEFPVVFDGDLFADPARLASLVGAGEHR